MNFLISYPRSGNSFFRYSIEFITRRPTLSCYSEYHVKPMFAIENSGILIEDFTPILAKEHHWELAEFRFKSDTKILFLLRDYSECISSHIQRRYKVKDFNTIMQETYHYFSLIKRYDEYQEKKLLIYYEDFNKNPNSELKRALDFLEVGNTHLQDYIENFAFHKKKSMELYHAGKYDKIELTPKQKKILSNHFFYLDKNLFKKYLTRYNDL